MDAPQLSPEQRGDAVLHRVFGIDPDTDPVFARGECSVVYEGTRDHQGTRVVAKVAIDSPTLDTRGALRAEMLALVAMNEAAEHDPPPLTVPTLFEGRYGDEFLPPFMVITRLEGTPLTPDQMVRYYAVNREGQQHLGAMIGSFMAWMDRAIPEHRWITEAGGPVVDKTQRFREHVMPHADTLAHMGLSTIAEAIATIGEGLSRVEPSNSQIVGNDEMHAKNLIFVDEGSSDNPAYRLDGAIDFGATQVTTPEQCLRHLRVYGLRDALQAAIDVFQEKTGKPVLAENIETWARLQVIYPVVRRIVLGLLPAEGFAIYTKRLVEFVPYLGIPELQRLPGHSRIEEGVIHNSGGGIDHLDPTTLWPPS